MWSTCSVDAGGFSRASLISDQLPADWNSCTAKSRPSAKGNTNVRMAMYGAMFSASRNASFGSRMEPACSSGVKCSVV